jgi:hypothetical protein
MTDLIAKPIIKNQYWVVTDGDKKVGNVVADQNGFDVKLHTGKKHFATTDEIKSKTSIKFEPLKSDKTVPNLPYPEYPTPDKIYNSMLDIKRRLHLFTETKNSKCYHVAGWFAINQNGVPQVIKYPKYIFIQRYPYQGPFKTESEAQQALNTV